jgi:hypothetical protein
MALGTDSAAYGLLGGGVGGLIGFFWWHVFMGELLHYSNTLVLDIANDHPPGGKNTDLRAARVPDVWKYHPD